MNRPYGRRIARRWAYRRLLVILLLFLMAAESSVYASDEFSRGGEEPCTSDAATCQETVPRHQGVGAQCSDLKCVLGIPTTVPETKKSEAKEQKEQKEEVPQFHGTPPMLSSREREGHATDSEEAPLRPPGRCPELIRVRKLWDRSTCAGMNCPAIPSEPIVIVLRHEWEYGLVREIRLTCSPDPTDMAVWGCRDTNNDPLPVFDWRETDLVTVTEIGVPSGWAPVRTTWQYGDEAPAPEFPPREGPVFDEDGDIVNLDPWSAPDLFFLFRGDLPGGAQVAFLTIRNQAQPLPTPPRDEEPNSSSLVASPESSVDTQENASASPTQGIRTPTSLKPTDGEVLPRQERTSTPPSIQQPATMAASAASPSAEHRGAVSLPQLLPRTGHPMWRLLTDVVFLLGMLLLVAGLGVILAARWRSRSTVHDRKEMPLHE